jgi:hypothetical protein
MRPTNLTLTAHFAVRARQRGYRPEDLTIIERLGTFRKHGIFLRRKDVEPEIERLGATLRHIRHTANGTASRSEIEAEVTQMIERLQRLRGAFIPSECGRALSIYRPCERRVKQILRGRRRSRRDRRYWR